MQKAGSDEAGATGPPEDPPPAASQAPTSQKSIEAAGGGGGAEFQISLNEFLEFLKLSCHVNDMIAKADMGKPPHTREPVPPMEGGAGATAKRNSKKDEFDFDNLADNPLVNALLGLRRPSHRRANSRSTEESRSSTSTTSAAAAALLPESKSSLLRSGHSHSSLRSRPESTYRGLHPKLGEQLDAVINEGVLDSVLSFICPVPMPTQLQSGKNKPSKLPAQQLLPLPTPVPMPASSAPIPPAAPLPGGSKSLMELGHHSHGGLPAATASVPCLQQAQGAGGDSMHSDQISNSMVRALVKEPIPKTGATNVGRRKSLLLVKDSKHARQEKKE